MANYRWTGATSGEWKLASNWVDADSGAAVLTYPGETALTYDNVFFDTAINTGAGAVACAGVSALTEKLNSLYIGGTYDGTLGSALTPIAVEVNTGLTTIDAADAGAIYLQGVGDPNYISRLIVQNGEVHLSGTFKDVFLLKGDINFDATTVITSIFWVGYMSTSTVNSDVVLTIPAGVTLPADIRINGGTITNYTSMSTPTITLGVFNNYGVIDGMYQTGGTFNWYAGGITTVQAHGGTFDAGVSTTARTVDYLYAGAGSTVNLDPTSNNITIGQYVMPLGGNVKFGNGMKLTTA